MNTEWKKVAEQIKYGAVGILPTDTIYGVAASVFSPASIERIYEAKGRELSKPFIILISNVDQLKDLGIRVELSNGLKAYWPGPISVIFPADDTLAYIHRDTNSLAVRLPDAAHLRQLIEVTGPIVATSANKSGEEYISDMKLIKSKLPSLDFYLDGTVGDTPSRLARMNENGDIEWLKR